MPPDGAKATKWKFIHSFTDSQRFEFVPGHNIWDYKWKSVMRDPPPAPTGIQWTDMRAVYELAHVIDPRYGKEMEFRIYEVAAEDRVIRFACEEFSNGIWGYYLPDESQS